MADKDVSHLDAKLISWYELSSLWIEVNWDGKMSFVEST